PSSRRGQSVRIGRQIHTTMSIWLNPVGSRAALRVGDQLSRRFAEGDSVAHFLYGRSESFNLLLLLRDGRFEFRYCALLFCNVPVLFQKLRRALVVDRLLPPPLWAHAR